MASSTPIIVYVTPDNAVGFLRPHDTPVQTVFNTLVISIKATGRDIGHIPGLYAALTQARHPGDCLLSAVQVANPRVFGGITTSLFAANWDMAPESPVWVGVYEEPVPWSFARS